MALTFFSKIYSILNNIKVNFYHVDHSLRKESSIEAKKLKNMLKKFNINCKILKWHGKKPATNIQAQARSKRYNLIANECKENKINFIFLHII